MTPLIKKILIILCAALVLAAAGYFDKLYRERVLAEEAAEAAMAANLAVERLSAVTVKGRQPLHEYQRPVPPALLPRKAVLEFQEQNPDTIGYLKVEGTRIDYPVVQGDDNDYYLNYTFDHVLATRGSIFLDYGVSFDPEELPRHMLIHGHHMRDGSMFQNVTLYKNKAYFEEHPYLYFETLYVETIWQVFSVYVCAANEYVPMAFRDDEAFIAYAQKTAERSMYPVEVSFTADDVIMTLNTCSYEFNGAHTLLVAKLVETNFDFDHR